jgi:diaminohydroxyphosphoribosylaminopyrimidine deaminase/5-amino-6-(5-phosphoribosylamino)uracil reductase
LKLERAVIAIKDPIPSHSGGAVLLETSGIKVEIGTEAEAANHLIEPFLIWQKRAFVLFKLAQTSNGKIGGGYLSSPASLTHVHQLREVCDRLLIGGNTVRADRPTLDCRFTGGTAPDVTIYSREPNFDRTIPLYCVEDREVSISNDLEFLQEPSFVLVEGGEGMLRALSGQIDWYLFYQTPKLSSHNLTYNIDKDLTFLHSEKKGIDIMIWSKKRDG